MNVNKLLFGFIMLISSHFVNSQELNSQTKLETDSFNFDAKTPPKTDPNIKNFPFHFGIEIGRAFSLNTTHDNLNSLWGFMDINLYRKLTFLKFEFGRFFAERDFSNTASFASIGLNFTPLKTTHHIINFQVSGAIVADKDGAGLFGIFSPKYVFCFNDYIGLSASLRYLYAGDHYIMFGAGIQFFTH